MVNHSLIADLCFVCRLTKQKKCPNTKAIAIPFLQSWASNILCWKQQLGVRELNDQSWTYKMIEEASIEGLPLILSQHPTQDELQYVLHLSH